MNMFLYGFLGFFGIILTILLFSLVPKIVGGNKNSVVKTVIFVVLFIVVLLFLFFFKDKFAVFDIKQLAPYVFAPLFGVYSYFFSESEKLYKKPVPAVLVSIATVVAIYLWIHPEVIKVATDPIMHNDRIAPVKGVNENHMCIPASDYKLYILTALILVGIVMLGYPYIAILIFIGLLFFW